MARILLAEQNRAIREFIAGILTEFGHDVQLCDNGIEASVWLATAHFDVLVTDMMLQDSQGLSLSRQFASLGTRTVTLTGREFHAGRAGKNPPPALFEKPFRFSDLHRVLNAIETLRPATAPRGEASSAA
jgi:two-component system cell cycle response regulator CpdR